jgi:hypothetical protein
MAKAKLAIMKAYGEKWPGKRNQAKEERKTVINGNES